VPGSVEPRIRRRVSNAVGIETILSIRIRFSISTLARGKDRPTRERTSLVPVLGKTSRMKSIR